MLGAVRAREGVGVEQRAGADGTLLRGQLGRAVHARALGAAALGVVRGPVDLLAARVRGDRERLPGQALGAGLEGDRVQGADAVHRQPEGVTERGGGHQADPQAGVRARADADRDPGQPVLVHPGRPQDPVDRGQQQFAVAPGIDLVGLGQDGGAVVDGGGDGGGSGVEREQQHGSRLDRR